MTKSVLRSKLERLSRQLTALRGSSPGPRVTERLLEDLADLQWALVESRPELPTSPGDPALARMNAGESAGSNGDPAPAHTTASESAGSNGDLAQEAWPRYGLRLLGRADHGRVLVRVMRTHTRCRWANRAWCDFTGRSQERARGRGWLRDIHPEDRTRVVRTCRDALASSQLYQVEYRLQQGNGAYGWVLEIGTPRLTSRGRIGGIVGTAIEITERKQTESRLAVQITLAHGLAQASTLKEAAPQILQLLCAEQDAEVGELWSLEGPECRPRCLQVWGGAPHLDLAPIREAARNLQPPLESWSRRTAWAVDLAADEALAPGWKPQRLGLRMMLCLPILVEGRVASMARLFLRSLQQWDADELEFLEALGLQIGQFLERQRNEERVRESEARKSAILEASLDAVITIDEVGRVVEFNSAAESTFGYPRQEVLGRDLMPLTVPPRMHAQAADSFESYRKMGTSSLLGKRFETTARRADGTEFPVEVAMAPISVSDPPLLTIFVSDVTARRSAQEETQRYQLRLRALMTEMLLSEEHERRRLASDLHDGLSQTIALAQIKLSGLRHTLDGKLKQAFDELAELIRQTDLTARSLGSELSPPILHELGLEPALRWLVENIRKRYGIAIEMQADAPPEHVNETTRVILFRSIRELLINAAKHARAHRVAIRLEREQGYLVAVVEDDGVGMEPFDRPQGSGLLSIHERLSHVGGSMNIESAPGRGTKIRLSAPLTDEGLKKARVET